MRFDSPQLDGLRFIAALLVFFHHAPFVPYLDWLKDYGWVGVDLFFAISAFLITKLILIEHDRTGGFDLKAFFVRRALRIWPLYFFYVTIATMVAATAEGWAWWLTHLTFTNNIVTALNGYSQVPFTAHLWTLSLEEQAYIAMALLLTVYLAGSRKVGAAVAFCLGGIVVLIALRVALAGEPHPFIWTLPLRADAFLLGALAALGTTRPKSWMIPVGLALLFSLALLGQPEEPGLYRIFGYTVAAAGCVALVVGSQAGNTWLGSEPLRYLGRRSYGIYIYHMAAIYWGTKFVPQLGFLVSLAITLGLSILSYRYLERPFLLLKERFAVVQSRAV